MLEYDKKEKNERESRDYNSAGARADWDFGECSEIVRAARVRETYRLAFSDAVQPISTSNGILTDIASLCWSLTERTSRCATRRYPLQIPLDLESGGTGPRRPIDEPHAHSAGPSDLRTRSIVRIGRDAAQRLELVAG